MSRLQNKVASQTLSEVQGAQGRARRKAGRTREGSKSWGGNPPSGLKLDQAHTAPWYVCSPFFFETLGPYKAYKAYKT